MKKAFISLVAAAAISGIALADSNTTTELDLVSIATQGAASEQSAGIVALSTTEAAEVVGGARQVYTIANISNNRGLKPVGSIWAFTKGPLANAKIK